MLRYKSINFPRLNQSLTHYFSTKIVEDIELHQHNSFIKVLLNKPKALNSLNLDMIRAIKA